MDNKTIIEWGWVSPEELWRAQWITAEADFLFPPPQFYYFPSSMFFIPLLHLHLLIYSIYFSIHKYIDLLATLHRPHIDPTSTPHRPYIDPTSTPHRPYQNNKNEEEEEGKQ